MSVPTENLHLFLPDTVSITVKLAETAAKIAFSSFQWRYVTLIFFNATLIGVKDFLILYDKSTILSTIDVTLPSFVDHTDQFVVFGQDVSEITNMLDCMRDREYDNTGRFIVICESQEHESCNETEAVNTFWYHKITNVVFVKYYKEKVIGFTYFYSEENCAMSEPVEMPNIEFCVDNIHDFDCNLFPEKFQNLHRCPLIASTFEQPPYMTLKGGSPKGCDGDLLLIIAEALNSTLQVMTPLKGDGWGNLDPDDGTWLGSLGDIYYDRANISMTSASLTSTRFSSFQMSYNYHYITVGWISSPRKMESSSLKLVHPFQSQTHIAVDLVFLSVIVIAIFIRSSLWTKVMPKPDADSQTVILYSWMTCMGLPTIRLPQKSFFLYMTYLWIWYTFLVRTMYQASLINSLKSNKYLPNVDTIEDAINADYIIAGGLALKDYWIDYPLVFDRYIGMNSTELAKITKKISRGENAAAAMNLEYANTFLKKHGGSLHIFSQKIAVSHTTIFFKKFSPLADPVSLIIRRLVQAGIPNKLYSNHARTRKESPTTVQDNEPMRLEHFTGCYVILALGWGVSTISFFIEIFFGTRIRLYIL